MYDENLLIEALERIARAVEISNELASERNDLLRKLLKKSGSSEEEEDDFDPFAEDEGKKVEDAFDDLSEKSLSSLLGDFL